MKHHLFVAAFLGLGLSSPTLANNFDLEGVAPGVYGSVVVSEGSLTLTITTTTGAPVWIGNLSNPPLLGQVGAAGNTGQPFVPLIWSFSAPVSAITFNFGDLGGDDDSPVFIEAYSAANVLLTSATTNYPAGFADGASLSLSAAGMSYFITHSDSADANPNSLVWDIGSVTPGDGGAIPEPASWALMIGGFAIAGSALRRQKVALRFA